MYIQIKIEDDVERVVFASHIKFILRNANISTRTYTPKERFGVKADIGLQAKNISLNVLAQIISQIENRGYDIKSAKGSDILSLSFSALSPQ